MHGVVLFVPAQTPYKQFLEVRNLDLESLRPQYPSPSPGSSTGGALVLWFWFCGWLGFENGCSEVSIKSTPAPRTFLRSWVLNDWMLGWAGGVFWPMGEPSGFRPHLKSGGVHKSWGPPLGDASPLVHAVSGENAPS